MDQIFRRRDLVAPLKHETINGIFCWIAYLFTVSFLLMLLLMVVGVDVLSDRGVALLQILDFAAMFLLIVLVFRKFLWRSLGPVRGKGKRLITTALIGFGSYYLMMMAVSTLILIIGIEPENLNNDTVEALMTDYSIPMFLCTVVLAPVIEECLVRGVIFAPLCRRRPWLAYLATVPLFAFLHVFSYIGQQSAALLAISFLQYLPAGIVLGWAYQRTGSIYGSILLHCTINLVASVVMLL